VVTYRARVTSPRPPTDVFDYKARFPNAAKWDPGVIAATENSEGPTLGSTHRMRVRTFGRAIPLEYRIAEFDRPLRVVLSGESSTVRPTDVIEVAADLGGGTIVTYDATLGLKAVAVLFIPLLDLLFRRIRAWAVVGLRAAALAG
jgi:hypothetical protein